MHVSKPFSCSANARSNFIYNNNYIIFLQIRFIAEIKLHGGNFTIPPEFPGSNKNTPISEKSTSFCNPSSYHSIVWLHSLRTSYRRILHQTNICLSNQQSIYLVSICNLNFHPRRFYLSKNKSQLLILKLH